MFNRCDLSTVPGDRFRDGKHFWNEFLRITVSLSLCISFMLMSKRELEKKVAQMGCRADGMLRADVRVFEMSCRWNDALLKCCAHKMSRNWDVAESKRRANIMSRSWNVAQLKCHADGMSRKTKVAQMAFPPRKSSPEPMITQGMRKHPTDFLARAGLISKDKATVRCGLAREAAGSVLAIFLFHCLNLRSVPVEGKYGWTHFFFNEPSRVEK